MKKYINYLLFIFIFFIIFKVNVNALDFNLQINASEEIRNQYSDYTLKITGIDYNSAVGGTHTVTGSGADTEITFDENGVGYLNVSLSQNQSNIVIADIGNNYNRIKVEFDSSKESTKRTGQSPMIDDDKILSGYFIEGTNTQIWNIEPLNTKINIPFKKYFEDEDYKEYRPSSSSFNLYNKNDMNTVIATTEIEYNNSVDEYDGEFTNIPKYDNKGNLIEYTIKESSIPYYTNSTDSKYGLRIKFNEQTHMGSYSILKMFYKDNLTGKLYKYVRKDGTLGDDLGGKTIEFSYPLSKFETSPTTIAEQYVLEATYTRSIEELVGNVYPETSHPYPLGEAHVWHYRNTISGHTQDFYMTMRTESWGGHFGLLIDNITTMGNDTVLTSTINLKDIEVTKIWEDEGYESYRPNSVVYDIYNPNDMNTIVRTVTLNKNTNEVDDNTWKLTVKNLPKYDSNSQEIEYTVVERPVENYFQVYDYPSDYNVLSVTYSDDTFVGSYQCFSNDNTFLNAQCLRHSGYSFQSLNYSDVENNAGFLNGKTLYFPSKYLKIQFDIYKGRNGFPTDFVYNGKITDIHLEKVSSFSQNYEGQSTYSRYNLGVHYYEDYLDFHDKSYSSYGDVYEWKYEWKGSTKPRANATIVKNLINLKDVSFTKKWDDEGLEDYRPESIKFKIYNEKNPNELVKEVVLTSENEKNDDSTIWEGTFKDVPKYNSDGSEAKYIIKEEALDLYTTKYSMSNIKGFLVEFDENSYASNMSYLAQKPEENKYNKITYRLPSDESNTFRDLKNQILYVPVEEFKGFIFFYSNSNSSEENYGFKIKSIKPVKSNGLNYRVDSYIQNVPSSDEYLKYSGESFPETTHPETGFGRYYEYTFEPFNNSFTDADIIINKANIKEIEVTKIWDDTNYENERPEEIVFNIYNQNDLNTIVNTLKLTKDDVDRDNSNKWNGKVGLKKYDNNGEEIEYVVEEVVNDKYTTTKDENNFTNKIKLYTVNILKTDENNNPLKGAKIKILNSNNVEYYSFETTKQEKVLTLPVGEYTLIEEKAPNGYTKSNNIKFTVDKDGNVIINEEKVDKVIVVNKKVKDATENPSTLDNISKYLIIFISSISIIISLLLLKKKVSKI